METVTVRMARGDRNQSWGFGVTEAPNRDVVIVNIVGGSLAERAGLRNGDVVFELEGLRDLDINAVDRLLVTSREKIELILHRAAGGQSRIWRPEITENQDMRAVFSGNPPPVDQRPYKVSLEHHSDIRAPQGFNNSALPFDSDPRVKHLQYNSPMGLYSSQNVEESYRQQTAGITGQSSHVSSGNQQPGYLHSETLRLIKEQDTGSRGPPSSLSSHPNPSGLPVCFVCTRPILGVMAQAAGHTIHGDCLSCATCGNSLRNVGHHFIENKFYCEIHGRQKRGLGPITMDPNLAVRTPPTAAQPVRKEEGVRAFYQPEILTRQPISPGSIHSTTNSHSQVNVHVSNPRTQGTISPSNRGVPTNPNYGGGTTGSTYASYGTQESLRPVSPRPPPIITTPAPPSNPPPGNVSSVEQRPASSLSIVSSQDSRVPYSVRDAVSPRRAIRAPRPWPPPEAAKNQKYWQIDPAGQAKKEREPEPSSLQEMIKKDEKSTPHSSSAKNRNRRQSNISTADVKKAFQQIESNEIFPSGVHGFAPIEPQEPTPLPQINSGIHWTVISGPKSPDPTQNVTKIQIDEKPAVQSYIVRAPIPQISVDPATYSNSSEPNWTENKIYRAPEKSKDLRQKSAPSEPKVSRQGVPVSPGNIYNRDPDNPRGVERKKQQTSDVIYNNPNQEIRPSSFQEYKPPPAVERPAVFPTSTLAVEPEKVDTSTSPIPVIRFERQKSVEKIDLNRNQPRLPCTSSPIPFQAPKINERPPTPPTIRLPSRSPIPPSSELGEGSLIGVNTAPKPFGTPQGPPKKLAKPLKKVDFSKTEFIPSPVWESEVVDESDMLTITSRNSDDSEPGPRVSYDADESIRSDEDELMLDEQEQWMKEELELAMKEELELKKLEEKWKKEEEEMKNRDELESRDDQSERDLAMVAALHERLNGLKEMEDADRQRAIECIERHQKALEEQQEQLAELLQSAIVYLRAMEPEVATTNRPPTPPLRGSSICKTDCLSDALEELDSIKLTPAAEKISHELERVQSGNQSFSRSTFEKTTTTSHNHSNGGTTNGVVGKGGAVSHNTASFGGRIPYCEACKQQIKGAFVLATGLAWCPEHFVCANRSCGRRLLECGFVEENGQKYCEGCFEAHIAPRCAKCAKPITSDCLNALHKKWHPTCFTCAHCHKPFGNSAFYLENGQPYCENDWNQLFTTKCVNCKYPIEAGDRWVEALGSAFHSNCFNCTRCQTNLEGESFYAKNGQPFCKMHA